MSDLFTARPPGRSRMTRFVAVAFVLSTIAGGMFDGMVGAGATPPDHAKNGKHTNEDGEKCHPVKGCPGAPGDALEPTEEPTEATEPTAEPTDPTEPTAEPTDPVEATEEPTDPAEPTEEPTDTTTEPAPVKAFPTAEGFGQDALGGRGGRVIPVTTLDDSGPGSLRAALEASGPRIVVFRVAGTIALRSTIKIEDPYVTVAGQTAPGDGVQIRNHPDNLSEALRIATHDVVVRHLRVRPGPTSSPTCCSGAVTILHGARDVVLDHVSLSWGVDENISSGNGAQNFTVQWSIIAQALHDSSHQEGPHSRGAHFGSWASDFDPSEHHSISLHHNLFAHNNRRNPKLTNAGRDVLVNNVIYNWDEAAIHGGDDSGVTFKAAFIGNHLVRGPDSGGVKEIYVEDELSPTPGFELHLDGNVGPNQPNGDGDQSLLMYTGDHQWMVDAPTFSWPHITTTSATTAYSQVLDGAGATRPVRDRVDAYTVNTVTTRSGSIIDDPSEVGGWPELAPGTPYPDTDGDGMDDRWESTHGLDPSSGGDGNAVAPNGYTWVENFLNELAGDPI